MDSTNNIGQDSSVRSSRSRSLSDENTINNDTTNESSNSNKRLKTNVTPASTPVADGFIQDYTQLQVNNNNSAPIYLPLNIKNELETNTIFKNIESCLVDYEKQIIYEKSNLLKPILSLNDNIFLINEKFVNDPYNVARVMKFIPKDAYSKIISSSNIKVFPAYTCDLIINWHFRDRDISTISRDKLYNSPRELIMSSIVATVKLSQYRGKVNLTFKNHITNLKEYLTSPNNYYFDRFYDRFSGEFFKLHCIEDLVSDYKMKDGTDSEYLKLLSMKAPYLYTELMFPFNEYMKFFISGENVSKNWRQQCNSCFKWCNYKTNMVKCDNCKEHYHVYCISDEIDKKNFANKTWSCEKCSNLNNNADVNINVINDNYQSAFKNTGLDLQDKEHFAKDILSRFDIKNYNTQNYRYQYLGFNNSECLANQYKSLVNLDYWNPIKEIQVNLKKCQHTMDDPSGDSERGSDLTITTIWDPALVNNNMEKEIELNSFTNQCLINISNVKNFSTAEVNFIDEVLRRLNANNIEFETTYNELITKCDKKNLNIPVFNKKELQLFEQGIKTFGGDPYKIHANFLKNLQPLSSVVKFFYIWKKTKHGLITRGKWAKKIKKNQINQDLSDCKWVYLEEQSCYDLEKYKESKSYLFTCKYCNCLLSPAWYKCDDNEPSKENVNEALCLRCAKIWKKYGVQWKPFDILLKQIYGRNNWKQILQRILTEENFVLTMDYNIISQNIEFELLNDLVQYIRDNYALFKNYSDMIKKYKQSCSSSRNYIIKNSWKFAEIYLLDSHEENGKKNLLKYVEHLEMEYSGRSKKKNSLFDNQVSKFMVSNNLYSMKFECILEENDYSIFITRNFDKIILSNENSILKLANLSEGDISVDVSNATAEVLTNFKLMHEKNTSSVVTVPILELNAIRPIECQILLIYKTAINEALKKANDFLHSKMELNPLRRYIMEKNPGQQLRSKCSVCLQAMSLKELSETEIICNCCGMNCHYYCYGETEATTKELNWKCDSCKFSNEDNCSLCITKETDVESCRNLNINCTPDALKLTDDNNKFVHVACALFTKGIEVSSEKFAPFKNVRRTKKIIKCKICLSGVGSVINCELCDANFHVTCAQDEENYKIGFAKESSTNPIIICNLHENYELLPLNHKYNGATLWELYLKAVIKRDLIEDSEVSSYITSSIKKCGTCDNDISLYWYPLPDGNYSCKNCHLNKIFRNVKLIQGADMDNSDVTFWDEYPIDKFYLEK